MVKYNVGIIEKNSLDAKNFTKAGTGISLKNCIQIAKNEGHKFVAIEPDSSSANNSGINITGTCYTGSNYNPISEKDAPNGTYQVYSVPDGDCATDDCLKTNTKSVLINDIKELQRQIGDKRTDMQQIKIKLFALENGLSVSDAAEKYRLKERQTELNTQTQGLNERLGYLNSHLLSVTNANNDANILLADKNKILANVNANIQQKYSTLSQVNDKINTTTQDIYTNNIAYERKQQIIKTLNALVGVLVLMALIMVVYMGVMYAQQNYPDSFASLNNSLNTLGFGNNPFG